MHTPPNHRRGLSDLLGQLDHPCNILSLPALLGPAQNIRDNTLRSPSSPSLPRPCTVRHQLWHKIGYCTMPPKKPHVDSASALQTGSMRFCLSSSDAVLQYHEDE